MKILDRTPTTEAVSDANRNGCGFVMLGHGKHALIDLEDQQMVDEFRWHLNGRGYAARLVFVHGRKSCRIVYLHRFLLGDRAGKSVDHINRIKTDNRKQNLRNATNIENSGNCGPRNIPKTSKFKGVCFDSGKGKFLAQGRNMGKMVFLGRYKNEEEAAKAYDRWAKKRFGQFAFTNFEMQ